MSESNDQILIPFRHTCILCISNFSFESMDALKNKSTYEHIFLENSFFRILTFKAKQKSLGDLNFFFQSNPENNSTFSNFAKQTNSFYLRKTIRRIFSFCNFLSKLLCFCLLEYNINPMIEVHKNISSKIYVIFP